MLGLNPHVCWLTPPQKKRKNNSWMCIPAQQVRNNNMCICIYNMHMYTNMWTVPQWNKWFNSPISDWDAPPSIASSNSRSHIPLYYIRYCIFIYHITLYHIAPRLNHIVVGVTPNPWMKSRISTTTTITSPIISPPNSQRIVVIPLDSH